MKLTMNQHKSNEEYEGVTDIHDLTVFFAANPIIKLVECSKFVLGFKTHKNEHIIIRYDWMSQEMTYSAENLETDFGVGYARYNEFNTTVVQTILTDIFTSCSFENISVLDDYITFSCPTAKQTFTIKQFTKSNNGMELQVIPYITGE